MCGVECLWNNKVEYENGDWNNVNPSWDNWNSRNPSSSLRPIHAICSYYETIIKSTLNQILIIYFFFSLCIYNCSILSTIGVTIIHKFWCLVWLRRMESDGDENEIKFKGQSIGRLRFNGADDEGVGQSEQDPHGRTWLSNKKHDHVSFLTDCTNLPCGISCFYFNCFFPFLF